MTMTRICALTTADNPYHPIEQFSDWFKLDCLLGYNSCAYIARIANFADNLTEEENLKLQEQACDEIIANDFMGIYKKVVVEEEQDDKQGFVWAE